jgi:hypothetical protein
LKQPEHTKNVLHPIGEQASNDFISLPQAHFSTGAFGRKSISVLRPKQAAIWLTNRSKIAPPSFK